MIGSHDTNDYLCVDRDCDWFERLGVVAETLTANSLDPISGRYQTPSRSEPRDFALFIAPRPITRCRKGSSQGVAKQRRPQAFGLIQSGVFRRKLGEGSCEVPHAAPVPGLLASPFAAPSVTKLNCSICVPTPPTSSITKSLRSRRGKNITNSTKAASDYPLVW
jgi:hypothetical protein